MPLRDGRYRFYAAEQSYFSGKVRPALRAKAVPHWEILPTPDAYRRVIRPRVGMNVIPVVVTPEDETWQDSSDILDRLDARFPDPPLLPATPVQRIAAHLVELYVDEFLVIVGLHWRWSHPAAATRAIQDFTCVTGDPERAARFAEGVQGACRLFGITDATRRVVEAHTRELLALLDEHLAAQPFVLGGTPTLADYALMGPLYGHLYLDAVSGTLLREHALGTCFYVERMNHPDPETWSPLLPDDALAPTTRRLLALVGRAAVPVILDCVRAFEAWADGTAMPEGALPRGVSMHATQLCGVPVERFTFSFTLWMVQRVLDAYAALDAGGRAAVDAALAGTGCEALLAYRPRHRVGRRPFTLFLDR
jgi:glutathione S-transferase